MDVRLQWGRIAAYFIYLKRTPRVLGMRNRLRWAFHVGFWPTKSPISLALENLTIQSIHCSWPEQGISANMELNLLSD
jgi:hypothetical protein